MSVILGPDFTSSLGIENPTLTPDVFEQPGKYRFKHDSWYNLI